MIWTMQSAETDNWVHIGQLARRLARRLVEQRLAAARQGPAPTPPPSNENGVPGQVHEFTPAAAPCSVVTPT